MKVRLLSLAVATLLVASTSQSIFANGTVIRDPDAVVRPGDIVAINSSKFLKPVNESHPRFAKLRYIKLEDQRRLGAWPIHVLQDGTISLPFLKPILADGMTITELENKILQSYVATRILRAAEINELVVFAAIISDAK